MYVDRVDNLMLGGTVNGKSSDVDQLWELTGTVCTLVQSWLGRTGWELDSKSSTCILPQRHVPLQYSVSSQQQQSR